LAPRLVTYGFSVTCSCEKERGGQPDFYKGTKLRYFPFPPPRNYTLRKMFEIIYDVYFILRSDYDIVYGLSANAGPFYIFPRFLGKNSIVNIDGIDWARTKYNMFEKFFFKLLYLLVEGTAQRVAIDSKYMANHVPPHFHNKLVYAPNGVNSNGVTMTYEKDFKALGKSFKPESYWLVVTRLEPENSIELIIRGYCNSHTERPLIIVGNFTSPKFEKKIKELTSNLGLSSRVLFTGGIYNRELLEAVRKNCFAYIHGHTVGGTSPALLEIMSLARLILSFDSPFNRETGAETILYFSNTESLGKLMDQLESSRDTYSNLGPKARQRALENYDWNSIMEQYVALFTK
jgi:rhamnosyltransferase